MSAPRAARSRHPRRALLWLVAVLALVATACGGDDAGDTTDDGEAAPATEAAADDGEVTEAPEDNNAEDTEAAAGDGEPLTVYSGRSEELVGPFLEMFTEETGIEIEVRYGDTAELAATVLEEGENSPADVYFGQDAGALGALASADVLTELPDDALELVEERFRDAEGRWVGVSGRARVLVYSTEETSDEELPDSVLDLTGEEWTDRVGWAPTNGSFQAFITAMRVELGDEATQQWVEDMIANGVQTFENNGSQVTAAGAGEIAVGLVNHYYLYGELAEDPDFPAANHYLSGGDPGALVNVAGAGVLGTSDQAEQAEELVRYMLSEEGQTYFAEETYEYPLVSSIEAGAELPPLDEVQSPDLDLNDLDDLEGTLQLLQDAGAL